MSFAFMPVYTGDYLRDTRHLSPLKHGVYFLLLMHCWDQRGPLPLDEQECAGIANCRSADEVESLRYILERFFTRLDDGWYNKRMAEEVARAEQLSGIRRENGQKGAEIRAARMRARQATARDSSKSLASAKQVLSKSQALAGTPTPTTTLTPTTSALNPGVENFDRPEVIAARWRAAGLKDADPKSPQLRELVAAGLTDAEFDHAAQRATSKGKGFFYALATAAGRHADGQRPSPPNEPQWWASEQTTEAKARELGMRARGGEEWRDFRERIRARLAEDARTAKAPAESTHRAEGQKA
jgi:uncharacterized protein YdaU (DUF1376 family)